MQERTARAEAAAAETAAALRAEGDALRLQTADLERQLADLRTELDRSKVRMGETEAHVAQGMPPTCGWRLAVFTRLSRQLDATKLGP